MEEQKSMEKAFDPARKTGGLYRHINVSVKTVNIVIVSAIVVLFLCAGFMIRHNGFTVTFDTDGGSHVDSQKVLHGETITLENEPTREGYQFNGWYLDKACTVPFTLEEDPITESVTLYANWIKKQ